MRILCPIENKVSQVISDIKERTDAQKSARSVCRQQLFLSGFLLVFRCICREMGFIFIQHSADHSLINEDWFRCSCWATICAWHEDWMWTSRGTWPRVLPWNSMVEEAAGRRQASYYNSGSCHKQPDVF